MIRSDYLCKRTVTLEYIYLFIVLGVVLATTNCEERCESFNNTSYPIEESMITKISFEVGTCLKIYIRLYDTNVTVIMYSVVIHPTKYQIKKRGDWNSWRNICEKSTSNQLSCGELYEFWISIENGVIKFGGVDLEIMSCNDTNPHMDIHRVAILPQPKIAALCFSVTDDDDPPTTDETSSTVNNNGEPTPSQPISMTQRYADDETQTAEQASSTMDNIVELTSPLPQNTNKPIIMSMAPIYGPVSGGTEVNITGLFLDSRTILWLGSSLDYQLLNITDLKSGNISAITPPYTRGLEPNVTGVVLNVIQLDNNVTTVTDVEFTYKPDPQVVDIYPRKMTKSGGLTVTVEGSSLDSVAAPMLTVTVIQRSDQNQRKTYDSPCKAETPKQLLCVTPEIPENPFNTKRKRHTTDNRRRRQSNDEELDFVLGLQFDGADNYEDLTDNLPHLAHIEVHQDPSFSPGQMFSFDPEFAGAIGIKGENIDAGVVVDDYNVSIGKGFCTNIGITSDKLYCNPPLTLDEVTDGNSINTTRAHNEVYITVRVGTNLVYTVGYIVYDIEETISLYTIFVPVVAALGALLVVLVIILIVCCCRKALAKKDSDKTLAPSAQDLNTLEPSRNDNYYTDETQPKNQYYMVVNQGANGQ